MKLDYFTNILRPRIRKSSLDHWMLRYATRPKLGPNFYLERFTEFTIF